MPSADAVYENRCGCRLRTPSKLRYYDFTYKYRKIFQSREKPHAAQHVPLPPISAIACRIRLHHILPHAYVILCNVRLPLFCLPLFCLPAYSATYALPRILPRTPPLSRISCRPSETKKRPCSYLQGRFSICLSKACTRSRGRTGTGVNLLVFETSASTDSAIRADFVKIECKCNHIFPFGKKSG